MELTRSTKLVLVGVVVAVLLVGIINIVIAVMGQSSSPEAAAPQTAPTVVVTETPTPTPTPTPTQTISEMDQKIVIANQVIDTLWDSQSKKDRDDMCLAYLVLPEMAEQTFKDNFGTTYGAEVQEAAWQALTKKFDSYC